MIATPKATAGLVKGEEEVSFKRQAAAGDWVIVPYSVKVPSP